MAKRFRDGVAALGYLLDTKERAPGQELVRASPDYACMACEDELVAFHRIVEAAAGVDIKRECRPEGPADIRYIQLADADLLAQFLGRPRAAAQASSAIDQLRAAAGSVPDWVAEVIDQIAAAWAVKREGYPGLAPGDIGTAEKFIRILLAIHQGEHLRGWDMRTFSQKACGDSKAVEAGKARLVRALRKRFSFPEISPREALASLGIEKFPQPVLVRGWIALPNGTEVTARPYVGLPPDWAGTFRPLGRPSYVLIIENLASFNRHAREIDDDGMVVFSGGFPSRATLAAIQCLDAGLPADVPFFHWGDTDRHGFLIFDHVAASVGRSLHQHMMDPSSANLEQEADDPAPPVGVKTTMR